MRSLRVEVYDIKHIPRYPYTRVRPEHCHRPHESIMSKYATSLDAIIIGAGPAGIAMAYQLKHQLGFVDFTIYEKLDGVGGTWRTNTYPGW